MADLIDLAHQLRSLSVTEALQLRLMLEATLSNVLVEVVGPIPAVGIGLPYGWHDLRPISYSLVLVVAPMLNRNAIVRELRALLGGNRPLSQLVEAVKSPPWLILEGPASGPIEEMAARLRAVGAEVRIHAQ